ncbi:hypothetical protein [Halobaculum sp. EA56]|uniref:hypothetical protein n=1 Tax=Halobaculum sp. EA56 TaxID=3421648 RepID=UPI003EB93CAA
MVRRTAVAALSIALLLVLAGCGGSQVTTARWDHSPDGDGATSPSSDPDGIEVSGGNLSVDPDAVWERVLALRGLDADPPSLLFLDDSGEGPDGSLSAGAPAPGFRRALGVDAAAGNGTLLGYVESPYIVHLTPAATAAGPSTVEYVLAHEFVHVTQFRVGAYGSVYEVVPESHDGETAGGAVTEGAAEYVAIRYVDRHLPANSSAARRANATAWRRSYLNASGERRLSLMTYYFGLRHVDRRVTGPADLDAVYRTPPRTTEALIHGDAPGSRYPPSLTVDRRGDGEWESVAEPTRMGELFVRGVLGTELPEERAAAGADGWGNDRRLALADGDARGYVWALRFDDGANATEFAAAFGAYLNATDGGPREANGVRFRVERPRPGLVVLVFGDGSFRSTVSVDAPRERYVVVET